MESNTPNNQPQPFKSTGVTPVRATSEQPQSVSDRFGSAAQTVREVEDRAAEVIDQAKQRAGEVYEQANKAVSEQYEKAVDFTRENPGKTTLIAFGIGVGVGALLLTSLTGSRSRRGRVVEPIMAAASTLAREFFR